MRNSNRMPLNHKVFSRSFTLPRDEALLNQLQNNPYVTITRKEVMPCPKEMVFMIFVDFEACDGYEDYQQ